MSLIGSRKQSLGQYKVPLAVIGIGIIVGLIAGNMQNRVSAATYGHTPDGDPFLGSPDAPVTIVEYSDFECPFCERFFTGAYPQIVEQYINTGKVRLVYKDFPLSFHANAQKAAEAAECADEQNMFFAMHDKIFQNQSKIGIADLKRYAGDLGLNTAQFNTCLDSDAMAAEVIADMDNGVSLGVNATPFFFVGDDQQVRGAKDFASFKEVIDAALAGAGA